MQIRQAALAATASAAVLMAMPAGALAGRGKITGVNNSTSTSGVTLVCVDINLPFITQPISFEIGGLQFSYDPNATCEGTGGATG